MTSIAYSPVSIQTSGRSAPLPPPWFGQVVLIVAHLRKQGVLDAISEQVRFARRRFGRYDVIDFVAVLFGYAISGERTLESFYERLRPFAAAFMAVMATWDIRSRKRPFEPSLPASFSLSGGARLSIQEGNRSVSPEKISVYEPPTLKKGIHRRHERPAKDLLRHEATSWMDLVHQLVSRTCCLASGCPMVVMVKPAHEWQCDHLVACTMRGFG